MRTPFAPISRAYGLSGFNQIGDPARAHMVVDASVDVGRRRPSEMRIEINFLRRRFDERCGEGGMYLWAAYGSFHMALAMMFSQEKRRCVLQNLFWCERVLYTIYTYIQFKFKRTSICI